MTRRTRAFALTAAVLAALLSVRPAAAGDPLSIVVSNVRDTSFAVSWLTIAIETGTVQVVSAGGAAAGTASPAPTSSGGAAYQDDRGGDYRGATHYVTVNDLQPKTTYLFDIVSGGTTYSNDGAHYSVTTGGTLSPPMPDLIVGRVRDPDGSYATDAIVILTIQQEQGVSAPISMLVTQTDDGFFHINLSDARTAQDPTFYFGYGAPLDVLTIQAVDAHGIGSVRVPVSDPRLHASNPNQAIVVDLASGAQTSTLVVRQPTPTPVPTASAQETGGLIVGLGAAVLIIAGIAIVAILFIWRR